MADQDFPAEYRVRRGADFRRAFQRRRSASDGRLIVYGSPNGLDHPRLGLSVSRKVGSAVVRNRWKRLLREAFRLTRPELPAGIDLVIVPRKGVRPTLADLRASLVSLGRRVGRGKQSENQENVKGPHRASENGRKRESDRQG